MKFGRDPPTQSSISAQAGAAALVEDAEQVRVLAVDVADKLHLGRAATSEAPAPAGVRATRAGFRRERPSLDARSTRGPLAPERSRAGRNHPRAAPAAAGAAISRSMGLRARRRARRGAAAIARGAEGGARALEAIAQKVHMNPKNQTEGGADAVSKLRADSRAGAGSARNAAFAARSSAATSRCEIAAPPALARPKRPAARGVTCARASGAARHARAAAGAPAGDAEASAPKWRSLSIIASIIASPGSSWSPPRLKGARLRGFIFLSPRCDSPSIARPLIFAQGR